MVCKQPETMFNNVIMYIYMVCKQPEMLFKQRCLNNIQVVHIASIVLLKDTVPVTIVIVFGKYVLRHTEIPIYVCSILYMYHKTSDS